MTDFPLNDPAERSGIDRRTALKGAAWAAPVLALSVASPLAAASVGNAGVNFSHFAADLLTLRVLDGTSVATAGVLITPPDEFTIANGAGAVATTATVTVVVARPLGVNLPVGRARGFGVYSLDGDVVAEQNTVSYLNVFGSDVGYPTTTFTGTLAVTLAANGSVRVPIEFGLSGTNSGINVSLLSAFPVQIMLDFGGGNVYTDTTVISVPAGAGLL